MAGNRVVILTIVSLFGAGAAAAQPGKYGPICAGLKSIAWCHQFDTGLPNAMATDPNGNTYVASGATLTALGPDGSVVYQSQFSYPIGFMAPGNGFMWVQAGSLFQVDGRGNTSPINYSRAIFAVSSDPAGNLYIVGPNASSYHSVVKLNTAGAIVGAFALDTYGVPTAITVDSSAAVYVAGNPVAGFAATPGAYQTTVPVYAYGVSEGYLLKIAPALDHVVYATLLYQGEPVEETTSPAAVAVDSQGDAYVAGYYDDGPGYQPFPANLIGVPAQNQSGGAYVLKLNPQGSALVWSDGLGAVSINSMVVLADGRIGALAAVQVGPYNIYEALFTVNPGDGALESSSFLAGVTPPGLISQPTALLAAPSGGSGTQQVLVAVNSARIPVIFNDRAAAPVLVDFADPPPRADLSLALSLVAPLVTNNGTVDFLATVTNNGPAGAEGVQVQVSIGGPDGPDTTPLLECFPGGLAICYAGGGALIPSLPAGASMNVEFVYNYFCGSLTCMQWIDGSLYALTSDTNLANNFASIALPFTTGFDAFLVAPQPSLLYYRSDAPLGGGGNPPPTADSSLTVWVPVQTYEGNTWYFDSWGDGNRDNPRVFDAARGIPVSQGAMTFHTALPFGVDPGSLDLVALGPGSPAATQVILYPLYRPGIWTIGTPAASWLSVSANAGSANDGSEVVTGAANTTGLAPGYYTTTFPAKLVVSGLPDANLDVPVSLHILPRRRPLHQAVS
jgi:hypothetical protein